MPVVPFVGGSYQMEAISFDNQRCKNLYLIMSEVGTSTSPAALRGTSGIETQATVGGGAIRGGIESSGRCFFVSGNEFYELNSNWTTTLHGSIDTNVGLVDIAENPTQVMITDGMYGYIFNKTLDTLTKIIDADFPIPSDLTFQDGYFIVTEKDTAKVWISGLNDGLTWGSLDFTTVESSPDNLVGLKSDKSNLWLFGTKTTEVYQNTGNALFPFQRIGGAIIETGCAAQATIQEIDQSIIWLGTDENGDAIVWQSNGYNARRISTQAIEKKISESTNFNESSAWVYHERGHAFYCLQVKGLKTTLCYDISTSVWHERTYRNPNTGLDEQHRAICHVFFNQTHLVGDKENNKVYKMALDIYSDDGDPIVRERISPHYDSEKSLLSHNRFELDMEVGVGLVNGQGKNPKVMMTYSDDGGRTWSSELIKDLGAIGNYNTRVRWQKLGKSRNRVYKVSISDPVFVQINEAVVNGR